ncbi:hypothetical protein AUK40_01270 [Candidatus Wirthbacteria bacterium CG2_30_54_11]|uniref:Uncharacterized protein n=1 Tax=Candidatus Wirthbacteria bacterium CG2_30_54_11 TaxID=1817892 RepID=A0A1J5INK9_9BACT|nr:MAG: hypothetical protein AUK40_01270 [Candidatus Wirthbacteria bacterium CG2_30_54_11]
MAQRITTFIGKIIGSRLPIKSPIWSTVYVYEPTIDRVAEARGNLYIAMDIPAEYEDLATTIINSVREEYYRELELDPLQSLEEALSHANKKIDEYGKKIITERQETLKTLNIACTILCHQDLHLAQIGNIDTYLIRKGRLNKISNINTASGKDIQSFQNIASGKIEVGDIVTISSPKIFEFMPLSQFKEIITTCYPTVAASRISEIITKKESAKIAPSLLILEINTDIKERGTGPEAVDQTIDKQLKHEKDEIAQSLTTQDHSDLPPPEMTVETPVLSGDETPPPRRLYADEGKTHPFSPLKTKNSILDILGTIGNSTMGLLSLIGRVASGKESPAKLSKVFLIVGLCIVGVGGFRAMTTHQKPNPVIETNKAFDEAYANFTQARDVLRNNDFVNAREYLLAAQTKAQEAASLGLYPDETTQLLANIQKELDKLDGVTRLENLQPIADTDSLFANSNPINIEATADSLFMLDSTNQKLYQLTRSNQQLLLAKGPIIADKQVKLTATSSDSVYLYATLGTEATVARYEPAKDTIKDVEVAFSNPWEKANVITSWTDTSNNTRLYFVDTTGNALWRYRPSGLNFAQAENYFKDAATPPDMTQVVDIAIDGNIWMLNRTGDVKKFTGTTEDTEFKLKGLKVAISDPTALFSVTPQGTSDVIGKKLYLADAGNERVLVFSKEDGHLTKIYAANSAFTDIRDLFVDEVTNMLYVLDGSKVYKIEM